MPAAAVARDRSRFALDSARCIGQRRSSSNPTKIEGYPDVWVSEGSILKKPCISDNSSVDHDSNPRHSAWQEQSASPDSNCQQLTTRPSRFLARGRCLHVPRDLEHLVGDDLSSQSSLYRIMASPRTGEPCPGRPSARVRLAPRTRYPIPQRCPSPCSRRGLRLARLPP